ncbi:hypothetical protein [Saccharopolyspora hattusasensis]|uniref:hypothetical protein n=1 Tax=Saccharopolyspora hattusasensis TaxID=1128679 RepID=UPI003D95C509
MSTSHALQDLIDAAGVLGRCQARRMAGEYRLTAPAVARLLELHNCGMSPRR